MANSNHSGRRHHHKSHDKSRDHANRNGHRKHKHSSDNRKCPPPSDLSIRGENINIAIHAFRTSGFDYYLSKNGVGVDHAVSFTVTGYDTGTGIFPVLPRTISGLIRSDGTKLSGTGFASERLGPGVYRVTFTMPFTAGVNRETPPVIELVAECSGRTVSSMVDPPPTHTFGGIVNANGTSNGVDFTSEKLPEYESTYRVTFSSNYQIKTFYPPYQLIMQVLNGTPDQGVRLLPGWDNYHFLYQTFETNNFHVQIPKDLPISFSAGVVLRED